MTGADGGVPAGSELAAFAEALVAADPGQLAAAISTLRQAVGDAGWVDAAGVAATFNAIDRVADATGIPLEPAKVDLSADLRAAIGLDAFRDGRGLSDSEQPAGCAEPQAGGALQRGRRHWRDVHAGHTPRPHFSAACAALLRAYGLLGLRHDLDCAVRHPHIRWCLSWLDALCGRNADGRIMRFPFYDAGACSDQQDQRFP